MPQSRVRQIATPLAAAAVAACVTAALNPLQGATASSSERRVPRNVIFMVGDGMAAAHRDRTASAGPAARRRGRCRR